MTKMTNDFCKYIYGLFGCLIVVLVVPACVEAQTSSVTMKATVSEIVALSVVPYSTPRDVQIEIFNSDSTSRVTLSGTGDGSEVVRVRLLVRSNTHFKITATAESETALVSQLLVTDARATGKLVWPRVVDNIVKSQIDFRWSADKILAEKSPIHEASDTVLYLSGPRVSLGGTLDSPNNALQITLLIRIKPKSVGGWLAHLTFSNN